MKVDDILKKINSGTKRGAKTKLANALNVSPSVVTEWFLGNRKPTEKNISKMAKIFDVSEDEILEAFTSGSKNFLSNSSVIGSANNNKGTIEMQSAPDTRLALLEKDVEILRKDIEIIKLKLKNYEK